MINSLQPHEWSKAPEGPLLFVVMDGVGIGSGGQDDAVAQAHTPTLDWLRSLPSATKLRAHGKAVGMPSDKDMGNSEVGHNAIGAGQVYQQGAALVADAVASGSLFEGAAWKDLTNQVQKSGEALHFIGLLSDGNVHSHIDHLLAMLRQAAKEGVKKARLHVLTDGRDVEDGSALRFVDQLEATLAEINASGLDYRIASGGGRMWMTMDRYEADWAMVQRGWQTHVKGEGRQFATPRQAIETLYEEAGKDDQHLPAFVIADKDGPVGPIRDGAAVIFCNFRGDRAIEISRAFEDDNFDAFDRGSRPDVLYAGMMQYDGDLAIPKRFLVQPPAIAGTFGERLVHTGVRQLALAETHKYGHVTYFWNGNRSGYFDQSLEKYVEIPSDLEPLEQRPWMKAAEVTDTLVRELDEGVGGKPFDLVRVNYANGDMVGHTGVLESTRMAVESVDLCLARLVEETKRRQGVLVVTADHGNADHMYDGEGDSKKIRTSHSLNPVPLAIFDPRCKGGGPKLQASPEAGLADLAGLTLELMGFRPPEDYRPGLSLKR